MNIEIRRNDIAYLRLMIEPTVKFVIVILLVAFIALIENDGTGVPETWLGAFALSLLLWLSLVVVNDKRTLIVIRKFDLLYYDAKLSFIRPKRIMKSEILEFESIQKQNIPSWIVKPGTSHKNRLKDYDKDAYGRCMRLILKNGEIKLIPYLRVNYEDRVLLENTIKDIVAENRGKNNV